MTKFLLLLFLLTTLGGCNNGPSRYELGQQSLTSGIQRDTIFGSLTFGLKESEAYKTLGISPNGKYRFNVDEIKQIDWSVSMNFYNDSLYYISFLSLNKHRFNDLKEAYFLKYGAPDFFENKNGTLYCWFNDNIEVSIQQQQYGLHITYEDISRNTYNNVIRDKDNVLNVYTPEYYQQREKPTPRVIDGI